MIARKVLLTCITAVFLCGCAEGNKYAGLKAMECKQVTEKFTSIMPTGSGSNFIAFMLEDGSGVITSQPIDVSGTIEYEVCNYPGGYQKKILSLAVER